MEETRDPRRRMTSSSLRLLVMLRISSAGIVVMRCLLKCCFSFHISIGIDGSSALLKYSLLPRAKHR